MLRNARNMGLAFAVAAVIALDTAAFSQPPDRGDRPRPGPQGKPDPAVEAWVKVLAEKMNDRHDAIRDSARAALVTLGPAAVPTLAKLAEGDDPAAADSAGKVMMQIQQGAGRGRGLAGGPGQPPGGFPGGPGRGQNRPGQPPEGGRRGPLEQALESIQMSPEQQPKVEKILQAHREKAREIHEKAQQTGNEEVLREAMPKLHEELMKGLKEVLSKEQAQKFEEAMRNARPPRGPDGPERGRPGPGGPPPGGDRRPDRPDREDSPDKPVSETASGANAGIQWFATWESSLRAAQQTGRPILLVSAAPHCAGVPGTW